MTTSVRSCHALNGNLPFRSPAGFRFTRFLVALCLALLMTACKSPDKAPSTHMAAVQIDDRSQDIIYTAVRQVFDEEGYTATGTEGGNLVFEKKGGTTETVLYGTWFNSSVWIRVKLRARPISMDNFILECDGFIVQDKGEMFFEHEQKVPHSTRRKLQKMLVQAKEMLQ